MFAAKDADSKAAASAANAAYVGTYNLIADEGMFTVTVAKKGKVSVSGTMADGRKLSAATSLLVGADVACAAIVATKQNLASIVWLDVHGADGTSASMGASGVVCSVVGLTNAAIGKPGALASGAAFKFDAEALARILGDDTYATYFPSAFPITVSGTKWVFPKAVKVALNKEKTAIDEAKLGTNPSGLKLTYTAKTGAFKGSFKAYVNKNGKPKSVKVSVSGLLVNGVGYGNAAVRSGGHTIVLIK